MGQLRVGITVDFAMPKYVYVNSVDEAVSAINAAKETIDLMCEKFGVKSVFSIINLEQLNTKTNEWSIWFDDKERDIHEYMQASD